jgi:hypothetical protein
MIALKYLLFKTLCRWMVAINSSHVAKDSKNNVLLLKFSFLRYLIDWAVVYVSNFSSGNLVDLICFKGCSSN